MKIYLNLDSQLCSLDEPRESDLLFNIRLTFFLDSSSESEDFLLECDRDLERSFSAEDLDRFRSTDSDFDLDGVLFLSSDDLDLFRFTNSVR